MTVSHKVKKLELNKDACRVLEARIKFIELKRKHPQFTLSTDDQLLIDPERVFAKEIERQCEMRKNSGWEDYLDLPTNLPISNHVFRALSLCVSSPKSSVRLTVSVQGVWGLARDLGGWIKLARLVWVKGLGRAVGRRR